MCAKPEDRVSSLEAPVRGIEDLGADYFHLDLEAGDIAASARPGQFVMVRFPGTTDPLLPRPFAVFGTEGGVLEVLFKTAGRGTKKLSNARPGDTLGVTGPLGNGWSVPEGKALLVAGGTAFAAVRWLAAGLAREGRLRGLVWGMKTKGDFPRRERLLPEGLEVSLATDDGSLGFGGTACELAGKLLDERDERGKSEPDVALTICGAGPVPMLRALAQLAAGCGLRCLVSLEARMACGLGTCRACVVNAKTPHPETGLRRRAVCTDGPVFDAGELDWGALT